MYSFSQKLGISQFRSFMSIVFKSLSLWVFTSTLKFWTLTLYRLLESTCMGNLGRCSLNRLTVVVETMNMIAMTAMIATILVMGCDGHGGGSPHSSSSSRLCSDIDTNSHCYLCLRTSPLTY